MNNNGGLSDLLYRAWLWLCSHPLGSWGAISAFVVSLWSDLGDGHKWIESILAGMVAVVATLSIIAAMHAGGLHESWWPAMGMLVGFIGVDRIKSAIRGAWDSEGRHRFGFGKGRVNERDRPDD